MLTAVKNQIKVTLLSIKYGIMKEMLNKATFLMNVVFMLLNNACFLIQWKIIYALKSDVGGYSFNQVLIMWALSSASFGVSHFFFKKAYFLSDTINKGKLDSFLVQPKNVLLSSITSEIDASALGDMIYGLIMITISGLTIQKFVLFVLFAICGGLIMTSVAVILSSLSFWISKSDSIADTGNNMIVCFGTYPEGIFNFGIRAIFYSIIPVGFVVYLPVSILSEWNFDLFITVIAFTLLIASLAFLVFYKGLKKYTSSNLMIAKI